MKRALLVLAWTAFAAPAAAQWLGEPVWNSPKGGTGLTISGDYAHPNADYGKGNTWGGRASLGVGTLTITAGVESWKPAASVAFPSPQSATSFGGNVAMRLIGGTLLPMAVNLQVGAARTDSANGSPAQTGVIGAVGFSVPLPAPGVSIEPYVSPGIRYRNRGSAGNTTEFGYAIGANVSFGTLGLHLAYDSEHQKSAPSRGVFGVGAHVDIRLPLGM